jgi:cell division protein FtsZ
VLFSIAAGDDLTMWEIQEAAKIITDSVDPNAKIIFGTVKDEKLKKNEIKITVIAANFPDNQHLRRSVQVERQPEEMQAPEPKRGIFNSFSPSIQTSTQPQTAQTNQPAQEIRKPEATPIQTTTDDSDDWAAVPAFLRRNKK